MVPQLPPEIGMLGCCLVSNDDVNRMAKLASRCRFTQLIFDLDSNFLKTNLAEGVLVLAVQNFCCTRTKKERPKRALF